MGADSKNEIHIDDSRVEMTPVLMDSQSLAFDGLRSSLRSDRSDSPLTRSKVRAVSENRWQVNQKSIYSDLFSHGAAY